MKLFIVASLLFSIGALAEVVVLDQDSVEFTGREVTLVRTKDTPTKVTLTAQFESYDVRCAERGIRVVNGPHPSCGQYTSSELNCRNSTSDSYSCTDPSPWDGRDTVIHDRSCEHEEIGCVRNEHTSHGLKEEKYSIKFTKLPKLTGDQKETFKLTILDLAVQWDYGQPRSSNYAANLDSVKTYKKYKILESDMYRNFEVRKTNLLGF